MSLFASGMSAATKETPAFCKPCRKCASRGKRSSLATNSVAPVSRAWSSVLASSGRSSRLPELDLEIGCEELRVVALAGNERDYGGLLRLDRP